MAVSKIKLRKKWLFIGALAAILTATAFVLAQTTNSLAPGKSPDFDDNGIVGYSDFFDFAEGFGKTSGQTGYNDKFDLNGDKSVNFDDFFIFADYFGKKFENSLCVPLLSSGNPKDKVNVLILGDGYPQEKMDLFTQDAVDFMNNILAYEPFKSYKSIFNFYRLNKVNDFGCGCKTNGRVGCCDNNKILAAAAACPYDQALTSINVDFTIGGAYKNLGTDGKGYAFMSRDAAKRNTVIHEFGHSFGALTDEYYAPRDGSLVDDHKLGYGLNCDAAACPSWCSAASSKQDLSAINCESNHDGDSCQSDLQKGLPCSWIDKNDGRWNVKESICVNTVSLCSSITQKEKCTYEETNARCLWKDTPDPILKTNCVSSALEYINFGKSCIEGAGCYRGCKFGNWYRSSFTGTLMGGEGAAEGSTAVFSPAAYKILVEMLNNYKK